MKLFIDLLRPLIVVTATIPVNILIFMGILVLTVFQKRLLRYRLAQNSAKLLLFLSGIKIRKIQKFSENNSTNSYYLGNFIGIEILPTLISIIKEPTCLILRWFNFFTPIFGWAFAILKFIPFSNNLKKFQWILNSRLTKEGYSVINFPAGYAFLHRHDSNYLFKSAVLRPLQEKVKVVPFAVVEFDEGDSIWFRSTYMISFLEEETFDPKKSKRKQIQEIEKK